MKASTKIWKQKLMIARYQEQIQLLANRPYDKRIKKKANQLRKQIIAFSKRHALDNKSLTSIMTTDEKQRINRRINRHKTHSQLSIPPDS